MHKNDDRSGQTRRQFLSTTAQTATLGAGLGLSAWASLTPKSQAEMRVPARMVTFNDEIEPLVRMIEDSPRSACFEKVAAKFAQGVSYRQIMAAVYLAAIRNISPDPVGGALHSVLVVHSCNHISLDAEPDDRMIPLFWAVDYFKQNQDRVPWKQGPPIKQASAGEKAIAEFRLGMERFDPELADRGITGMARTCGGGQIAEELWHYGARDYRPIGHKAVYSANAWRTLETIGRQHAEPTLRALARSLVGHGANNRTSGFTMDEQCYAANLQRVEANVARLPADWSLDKSADAAVTELMAAIRSGDSAQACQLALNQIMKSEQQSQGIWDAVHLAAGEIVYRQTSIRPIHAVTSANGLHYAFNAATADRTRLLILLQAVGWMAQFVTFISGDNRRPFPDRRLERMTPAELPADSAAAIGEIAENLQSKPDLAARQAFAYAQGQYPTSALFTAARRLIVAKAEESHRYKFPAAAMEDLNLISPRWRAHFLAAMTYYLPGDSTPDSAEVKNARAALAAAV